MIARFGVRGSGFAVALMLCARLVCAQDTHLLVITGVGGDEEHTANFHKWASSIVEAAKDKGGLTDATITYLGDKPELDPKAIKARPTRANV